MKYLILGCNGMAGHMISQYLKEQGHEVTGFARRPSLIVDSITGDAMDTEGLKRIIVAKRYDTIINCIGVLNKEAENDKARAVFLNSYLPHFLACVTEDSSIKVIQISTDCVFSGKKGNYEENDCKDGETFYDRTKALGELNDEKNITLRTSIVGPDTNPNGIGLMNWFMQQHEPIKGFTNAIWTGQTTLQLAKTIEVISESNATGLFNMVPKTSISKFELLQLFNKYLRNNSITIEKDDRDMPDKSLKRTNFSFDYSVPNYDVMISELSTWIREHSYLYLHY